MSVAGNPVSITRMELLARKAQIALASQGRDLLEQKRTALMKELLKTVDMVMERGEALQDAAAHAHQALARAEAAAGTEAVEAEVHIIIRLAESELRLRRLAEEIQQTSRRLNALDHLLIPRLEAERDLIQTALDERERADHFRLKLMKRILERKRGAEK